MPCPDVKPEPATPRSPRRGPCARVCGWAPAARPRADPLLPPADVSSGPVPRSSLPSDGEVHGVRPWRRPQCGCEHSACRTRSSGASSGRLVPMVSRPPEVRALPPGRQAGACVPSMRIQDDTFVPQRIGALHRVRRDGDWNVHLMGLCQVLLARAMGDVVERRAIGMLDALLWPRTSHLFG